MKSCNLILHCGAEAVERDALRAVRTPVATSTWQPVSHLRLVEQVERALAASQLIRPIMLLQAQPKYEATASITVDVMEAKLKEFGIPPEEICVHTGDRPGLNKINVLTKESKVRFIITVQALKEGWDCPWAYVLFSVAEMSSSKAVEQILGRVLRMPKAKRKKRDDLNNAYQPALLAGEA